MDASLVQRRLQVETSLSGGEDEPHSIRARGPKGVLPRPLNGHLLEGKMGSRGPLTFGKS